MEEKILPHVYSHIEIGGVQIPFLTDATISMWIVMAVIMVFTLVFTRKLETVPGKRQKLIELTVEFVTNFCKTNIGHRYKKYVAYIGTILIFLVFSNTLGLFSVIPSGDFFAWLSGNEGLRDIHFSLHAPTKNINVVALLAAVSMSIVLISDMTSKGAKGFIQSFYKPNLIYGGLKVLDYFVRPLSLCLRLFGNILGGFIVLGLIYNALPIGAPAIVSVYFDIFDGALQAYIFFFLTTIYIAEAVETHEEVK